jgi:periplasmic mercuric ion binding protein
MIKKTSLIFLMFLFISFSLFAQGRNVEQVEFTVLGNCGMCKERIEKAAFSVKGVRTAQWDRQKQSLALAYRTNQTSQDAVERAIAKAGHDTENFLTDEKTYANMHHCCVYKRDASLLEKNKVYNEK